MTISVVEAGRKGGLSVLTRRGRAFYSEIGKKGQQAMRQKYPNMASEWGKLGGRPKKAMLNQITGEKGEFIITKGGIADPPDVTPVSPT